MKANQKDLDIIQIASQFQIIGGVSVVKPYGSGHINVTYYLHNILPGAPNYLLQRINNVIFKNVPALMENISAVIDHLKKKLANIPGAEPDKEVMTLVQSRDNQFFHRDTEGNYWRMYQFLENTWSYDILENAMQAYEGGRAFGRFQSLLIDLDIESLHYTIPDFHNLEKRVTDFDLALSMDT